jgi:hypothetical protein
MQRLFKSGGVHFPAYDFNGNVMGMVNATMAEWQIEGKGCCKR